MFLTFEQARFVHSFFKHDDPSSRVECANRVIEIIRGRIPSQAGRYTYCDNEYKAGEILKAALHVDLDNDDYLIGATLCWGTEQFDIRPHSVQLIWSGLQKYPELLIFGAGSQGKSFTPIVFGLMDWERDPEFTTTKIVSTTEGHAKAQTFSNLVRLHRSSCVPLSGYIKEGFIGLDKDDERAAIAEVAIPQGDDGKARLQGFHPLPRPYAHPKFGTLTRVRGIFDEFEDIPVGIGKGISNMMQNLDDKMHVSYCGMWNPKRRDSLAAQMAEPIGGWANLDERLDTYVSRMGIRCIRLDARRCENVVQRQMVYPGLQSYEGFLRLENAGGPDRDTFAYGIYPAERAAFNIISPMSLDNARGKFIWARTPTNIASLDMAEEGEDKAMFTAGQYGLAIAYMPEGRPRISFQRGRWVIQVEQQFPLLKQNTILMGKEAISLCRRLRVAPEWFALDCTSTVNLRDWIGLEWGGICGIKWGEAATNLPILEEGSDIASDLYANIKTEMIFATGSWIEFGYMAFAPHMDTTQIFSQLSSLKYVPVSKTLKRCESTKDYKKRSGGKSPDEAASVVMLTQMVRENSVEERPAMQPETTYTDPDVLAEPEYVDSEEELKPVEWI